jgi:hypothetical protein
VTRIARFSSHATFCQIAALVTSLAASGCGGDGEAAGPVHDRLWLTKVPKKLTDEVGAFLVVRASESKQYGFLFKGSLYRGSYDTFHWAPEGEDRAKLRTVQDDKVHDVRIEACEPDAGFQYCMLVHGDPQGVERYQSRKGWGLGKPNKLKPGASFDLASELRALAAEDEDVAAVLDALESEQAAEASRT